MSNAYISPPVPAKPTIPSARPLPAPLSWAAALALVCSAQLSVHPAQSDTAAPGPTPTNSAPAVRRIALAGPYTDHPDSSSPGLWLLGGQDKPRSFPALCRQLADIASDPAVTHVLLDLQANSTSLSLAHTSELARQIEQLRAAGKKTLAWIEQADTARYAVACACDTVVMTPLGTLDLPSLSLTTLHFHDAMQLLGVEASAVRTGDFKGAVEPFTRAEMSPELRAHYLEMLTGMNDSVADRLAARRHLTPAQVRQIQATRLFTAQSAHAAGLVDLVAQPGTQRDTIRQLLRQEPRWIEPAPPARKPLSLFELAGKLLGAGSSLKTTEPALAVLHLDGPILDETSAMPGLMAPSPILKTIDELATNRHIRAVVVRINSPGGSASASEAIRQALSVLARKKTVTVSMGEVAASGGYWISCLGRPIYAEAETITGSIGVFSLKISLGPLLDRIGLNLQTVQLDDSASAMSIRRPWSAQEQTRLQELVEDVYRQFISLISTNRHLTAAELEPLAGGRVWSGQQALQHRLVDHLGGLTEAIAATAKTAKLPPGFPVHHFPRTESWLDRLGLFEDPASQLRLPLNSAALQFLHQSGFRLAVPWHLLRPPWDQAPPQAWLLLPTEFMVR